MLCYLADIFSMCRLASWQAETTSALGMLSVQEISFILTNAPPNPPSAPAMLHSSRYVFSLLGHSLGFSFPYWCFSLNFALFCAEMKKHLIAFFFAYFMLIDNSRLV